MALHAFGVARPEIFELPTFGSVGCADALAAGRRKATYRWKSVTFAEELPVAAGIVPTRSGVVVASLDGDQRRRGPG